MVTVGEVEALQEVPFLSHKVRMRCRSIRLLEVLIAQDSHHQGIELIFLFILIHLNDITCHLFSSQARRFLRLLNTNSVLIPFHVCSRSRGRGRGRGDSGNAMAIDYEFSGSQSRGRGRGRGSTPSFHHIISFRSCDFSKVGNGR